MRTIKSLYVQCFDFPGDQIPRTTAQQKRYNSKSGKYYQPPELIRARNYYTIKLNTAARDNHVTEPFAGPVSLSVLYIYKTQTKKHYGSPKLTRPDCDNSVKLIQDCIMDAGIIADDSQVFDLHVVKTWGPENRVDIMIRLLEEEQATTSGGKK